MAITLHFHDEPGAFLEQAAPYLEANPVASTVISSVAHRLLRQSADSPPAADLTQWWLVVRDGAGEVVGTAMRSAPFEPHPPYLLAMPDLAAVELARALHARGEHIEAVNGALPAVRVCAEELARRQGGSVSVRQHTRLFELGELVSPPRPAGSFAMAGPEHTELARDWYNAFAADAAEQAGRQLTDVAETEETLEGMARRIAERRVALWLDESGRPVSLTGFNLPSFGVARVGPVYTPREHRGRGYAGAGVAEVSRRILAAGDRPCLFTDQANPTSNRIYVALGYRQVEDQVNLRVG